jgi:hypothetical protein
MYLVLSAFTSSPNSLNPTLLNKLKGRHFSSDAKVIAAAETWLDGQLSELFLSGLQKLEFGRCSLFPSWSG